MRIFNTKSRTVEPFTPLNPPLVTLYTCGPTVYDYTHIGHIRKYVGDDVLKRTLMYLGYKVNHVMNITDVGHLTDDADAGEDKLEKGAQKTGKTVWEVADFYTQYFLRTMAAVNVLPPNALVRATDHIAHMIALIQALEAKGFTYTTDEAVYFNTQLFPSYGQLSGQSLEDKTVAARDEVYADPKKQHPADFALWFFRKGRFAQHTMHWDSPWGDGFPGWHIECSAMSMAYLGETIDIHTGGIDHIPVHHENEIAQSEAATGKPFVRFWVHHAFLQVNGEKMSKSKGNFYTIDDVVKNGIEPLSLRLLFMQTNYRKPMNFTWEAAQAAHEAYKKLVAAVRQLKAQTQRTELSQDKEVKREAYLTRFRQALEDDMNTSEALAVMWEVIKSNIPSEDRLDLLYSFDEVLGFNLRALTPQTAQKPPADTLPSEVQALAQERWQLKQNKEFAKADEIRKKLFEMGYFIVDTPTGYTVEKVAG